MADDGPRLLAGGNPQIPKGVGEEVVQAYVAAMPGWKRGLGERLDALVTRVVPGVAKQVKWNQPFYCHDDGTWFVAFRCFTRHVQVQFSAGASLDPEPPKAGKHPTVRSLDLPEDAEVDEALLASWIEQASRLPGEPI